MRFSRWWFLKNLDSLVEIKESSSSLPPVKSSEKRELRRLQQCPATSIRSPSLGVVLWTNRGVQETLPVNQLGFRVLFWKKLESTKAPAGFLCTERGRTFQPTSMTFLAFFYVTLWSWKKLPLFEGFHQQTIRWLPSKSDPQITSKMEFFHNWPDRSCMPCPGRHCCIDLDQLLHWKVGDLGWNVYRHPWNSIQKYCWRCSPKTNFILQKYLKFLCWIRMGLFGTIPTGQCSKIWETIDGGDSYPSPKLGEHRVFWKVSVVDSYIFQSSWWFQLSIYLHHWYVVKFDHFPSKNALRIVETT